MTNSAATFDSAADWGMADWARQAVAWGSLGSQLPDTSVKMVEVFQACCKLPKCNWASGCLPDRQLVEDERQRHLDEHRAALEWARGEG